MKRSLSLIVVLLSLCFTDITADCTDGDATNSAFSRTFSGVDLYGGNIFPPCDGKIDSVVYEFADNNADGVNDTLRVGIYSSGRTLLYQSDTLGVLDNDASIKISLTGQNALVTAGVMYWVVGSFRSGATGLAFCDGATSVGPPDSTVIWDNGGTVPLNADLTGAAFAVAVDASLQNYPRMTVYITTVSGNSMVYMGGGYWGSGK